MIVAMMMWMLMFRPIQPDEVVAVVRTVGNEVVAVEVVEDDGNIEIYEFYGADFEVGEDVTLLMVGDAVVGVAER